MGVKAPFAVGGLGALLCAYYLTKLAQPVWTAREEQGKMVLGLKQADVKRHKATMIDHADQVASKDMTENQRKQTFTAIQWHGRISRPAEQGVERPEFSSLADVSLQAKISEDIESAESSSLSEISLQTKNSEDIGPAKSSSLTGRSFHYCGGAVGEGRFSEKSTWHKNLRYGGGEQITERTFVCCNSDTDCNDLFACAAAETVYAHAILKGAGSPQYEVLGFMQDDQPIYITDFNDSLSYDHRWDGILVFKEGDISSSFIKKNLIEKIVILEDAFKGCYCREHTSWRYFEDRRKWFTEHGETRRGPGRRVGKGLCWPLCTGEQKNCKVNSDRVGRSMMSSCPKPRSPCKSRSQ
eukprot:gnl/MRDRNA2_/MRDRNA2_178199_c0_seq1.p1 gnl/MRDRNA2_/MRDRNA2_178199_c0~~gnl/MRDRNA2_/MRDRNA2_178199_c0_seq1.p1  ORF type:complete len:354 (+),score=28.66 gnl/MRDRNA2_/MRDRNA2_178199_c0_seq1:135-1196(+)